MRASLRIAVISSLILATSCAKQYSTWLEVGAEDPGIFSRADCEAFVVPVDLTAGRLRLERTESVPDDVLGYSYIEYSDEEAPVSIAVFCGASVLQVRITAVGRDPVGIAEQPSYQEATSELVRVLTEQYGPQLRQRNDTVSVRWWPKRDDA
jgi:hypothetical protein